MAPEAHLAVSYTCAGTLGGQDDLIEVVHAFDPELWRGAEMEAIVRPRGLQRTTTLGMRSPRRSESRWPSSKT